MDCTPKLSPDTVYQSDGARAPNAGFAARASGPVKSWHRAILPPISSLAILVVIAVLADPTWAGLVEKTLELPVWVYAGIVFIQFATILLGSIKWQLTLRATGARIGLRDAVAATSFGVLLGQILPLQVVTPLSRAWFAARAQVEFLRSVSTSLVEQATEVLVLCLMVLFGVALGASGKLALPIAAFGLAAIVAVAVWRAGAQSTVKTALTGLDGWIAKLGGPGHRLVDTFDALSRIRKPLFLGLIGLSLVRFVLFAALNVTVLALLVPEADALILIASFPLVLFLMSLPIFPGGLGVVEVTWSGVLIAQGVPAADAIEAAIVLRVVSTAGFLIIAPVLISLRSKPAEVAS